jgi:hypothetical protein
MQYLPFRESKSRAFQGALAGVRPDTSAISTIIFLLNRAGTKIQKSKRPRTLKQTRRNKQNNQEKSAIS